MQITAPKSRFVDSGLFYSPHSELDVISRKEKTIRDEQHVREFTVSSFDLRNNDVMLISSPKIDIIEQKTLTKQLSS